MSQPTPSRSLHQPSVWEFFREFLRERKTIGAVAPASRGAGRRMCQLAGVHEARNVVEFGPGTGAITTSILAELPENGRLWAYEIHEPFLDRLRETFHDPRLALIGESAENVPDLRNREVPEGVDAIICSIPFSLLPRQLTSSILKAAGAALRPGGALVALQYRPNFLMPMISEQFEDVRRTFYPWNVPPVILYTARNPRGTR